MSAAEPTVRVGVAAFIPNAQGALVIGKRKGKSGDGQFAFPGGHQEVGETYFQCAEREALEETGLEVTAERVVAVTDSIFDERTHYITIYVQCRHKGQVREPKLTEPEKCYGWTYLTWEQIKAMAEADEAKETTRPLFFLPIVNLLKDFPDISVLSKLACPGEVAGSRTQPLS